jgi:hypothetical protein
MPFNTSSRNAADDLRAVNFALAKSWPFLKLEAYASAGTIASGTLAYDLGSLTPLPSRELGVAIAYIDINDSESPVMVKHVRQYYDVSSDAWTLEMNAALANAYSGRTMYVRYQYPHPKITALTDHVYAKVDVAGELAALFYHHLKGTSSTYDSAFNRAVAPEIFRSDEIAKRDWTDQLPVMVPIVGRHRL